MSNQEIKLAKFAGFCYGVKRAVETVKKLKAENPEKNIYILGELIHNTDVINELESLGIKTIYEIPTLDKKVLRKNDICVIRSHGEAPAVFEQLKNSGFEIVDLTCPDVKKVQQSAVQLAKDGYFVVIVGKSNHPEVIAIKANADLYSDKVAVASTVEELYDYKDRLKSEKKIGVVVQTTQKKSTLDNIVNYLKTLSSEVLVHNTICRSTEMRRKEAGELASNSDLMVVVGSKKSANTTHLAEILGKCTKTIHIENHTELKNYSELIKNADRIGITAGASTPQSIITKVTENIKGGNYDNN